MKIEDLRIGQEVQVVSNYQYPEWNNEKVTIIGLDTDRGENILIKDKHGDKYDGFEASDFVGVVWYSAEELRTYLWNHGYSDEIVSQLAEQYAKNLQLAFEKGRAIERDLKEVVGI